jgi:DNA-binding MarR family transcriptional regulator
LIEDTIRTNLREEFGITLPRFDLMAQLERHPDGLSMGELSRRMMVTGGNITTIVDQLENEKLVMRLMSEIMAHTITLHLLDAPGRVKRFLRKHPELFERIPKKELASYLNLSAETLSRLKQRGKI